MEITQKQADHISRILHEEKRILQECPVCHASGNSWTMTDRIWELREFWLTEPPQDGESACPVISILCNECGYTLFFSAVVLGLIELEDEEDGEDDYES